MNSDLSDKKRLLKVKVISWFAAYSILQIIGAFIYTSSNKDLNPAIDFSGKLAFFGSPIILFYSIFFAVRNKSSKFLILFCVFILPPLFFLCFELVLYLLSVS
jgi:Mn2+/Fe2+ NRAMP family transporter